ncbi:hypothetical protein PDM84_07005 [Bacillus cereus]|nr:hypothetical protein [Bacillus cereus]
MRNEKKEDYSYIAVLAVVGIIIFISISLLILFFHGAAVKEIYAVSFSIVGSILGGLIGGFLTLLGVKRTIEDGRERDFFQKIPNKIVALHDLNIASRDLSADFIRVFDKIILEIAPKIESISPKLDEDAKITLFMELELDCLEGMEIFLKEKEREFIKYSSQIDITTYKQVIKALKDVEKVVKEISNSKYWLDEYGNISTESMEMERDGIGMHIEEVMEDFMQFINSKLDYYGELEYEVTIKSDNIYN